MKRKVITAWMLFLLVCLCGQEVSGEKRSEKYELQYIEAKKFIEALPEEVKKNKIHIMADGRGFVIR